MIWITRDTAGQEDLDSLLGYGQEDSEGSYYSDATYNMGFLEVLTNFIRGPKIYEPQIDITPTLPGDIKFREAYVKIMLGIEKSILKSPLVIFGKR